MQSSFRPFPVITTERLILRRSTPEDAHVVFRLRTIPEVAEYTFIPVYQSEQQAADWIQRAMVAAQNGSSINWTICLKTDPQMIGGICLFQLDFEKEEAEIGYELLPEYQHQGYMQEAIAAVHQFARTTMQCRFIVAGIHPDNQPSAKALLRTGYTFEHTKEEEGRLLDFYRLALE